MTKKEIESEMLKRLHKFIELHMSHDIDIMGFSDYNEDTQEYETCYKGPGNPTYCDYKLASIFMCMKHSFEYQNHLAQSFDMSLPGD
jgi:hypothetical protein